MVSKVSLQRYLRGRRDIHKIRKADVVFVSYAKAGRTWVRTMISKPFRRSSLLPLTTYGKLRACPKAKRNSMAAESFF